MNVRSKDVRHRTVVCMLRGKNLRMKKSNLAGACARGAVETTTAFTGC